MQEALDKLHEEGIVLDAMRIRAFPFNLEVWEFIEDHDLLFIVEQNRDGQMRTLFMAEGGIIPDKLVSILCFDCDVNQRPVHSFPRRRSSCLYALDGIRSIHLGGGIQTGREVLTGVSPHSANRGGASPGSAGRRESANRGVTP